MDDDWASKRNNGSGVIVEGAIEVLPRGDGRVEGGLAKKVESDFCLVQEKVPEVIGEIWRDASEDGEEVGLESLDGSLCCIATMHVRWNELELDAPISSHDSLEFGTDFVVKNLEVNLEAFVGEASHD